MTNIVQTYFDFCKKYKNIYEKSIVLLQVGSFMEIYSDLKSGPDIDYISSILDIQSTRKNKSNPIIDISNPKMAGIPCSVKDKYIDILLNNGYTIILVEQVTLPPNPKREVTKIISPATRDISQSVENNYLMCLYFTIGTTKTKEYLTSSITYVDINTNHSYIYENTEEDTNLNLEDIFKTIITNKPSEIVIFTDIKTKKNENLIKLIFEFIKTLPISCIHNRINKIIDENYFKLNYQNTILNKVFKDIGFLSVIEYLDLENLPLSVISYTYLLQFCYEHNEKLLEGLIKPVFLENTKYLSLVNNVLENLNIISKDNNTKTGSILNLLNNCKTSIGKRFFKQNLINPIINVKQITEIYDITDYFINNELYKETRPCLSKISDLERTFKRLLTKNLQPPEFVSINESFISLQTLYKILEENKCDFSKLNWSENNHNQLNDFMTYYNRIFNFEEMEKVNLIQITKNIFKEGVYPIIDNMQNELINLENIFENVCLSLNDNNENNSEFKLDMNKDNVRTILITKNRFDNLLKDKKRCEKINMHLTKYNLTLDDITAKPFSTTNKTVLKISFKGMSDNQILLNELQSTLKKQIIELYLNELEYFCENFGNIFNNITEFIAKVDFFSCNAKNAIENCYIRPNIVNNESSYIKTEGLRHPLIEKIQVDTPYISNNLEIGTENRNGMLLYGYNGIGKTSLLKSVGISVIMAQAGLYVSAKSFEFAPYNNIMSRFPSGDNIYKNQSTFQVEISELRTILKRSTQNSLVISDELCSGTESTSAISIIGATIVNLSGKNSSFLMASHLHEIVDLNCVKVLSNINVYHMEVKYDDEKKCLIYNRILREGQGSRIYGLEVCKSLDLPVEFLQFAENIRKEYYGITKNIVEPKKSVYNSDIFMDTCTICGEKTEEIHHIQQQKDANTNGIIESEQIHKNRKSNLINVCSKCHDNIHSDKIQVNGFIQTSSGIQLDYKIKEESANLNKIEDVIKKLRNEGNSYTKILQKINEQFEDKITLYKVKKYCSI